MASSAGYSHHPVFRQFPCWDGKVPEGFMVNFLGVLTRVDYFESYSEISRQYPADRLVRTDYPSFDEEYFEWIDLLEAVVTAEDHFTMLELGAGFGRWTANAATALRSFSGLPHTFVAVEAEPTHFQWMMQHLADNSIDSKNLRSVQAAVARSDGSVGFYVGKTEFGAPENWYGQCIGGSQIVNAVSLSMLLQPLQIVDLIDIDVQGVELEVLQAADREMDEKVKRVHIGTHGPKIEEGLHSLFRRLGWECLRSFACGTTADTEVGTISFQDGVQTWVNPTYLGRSANESMVLREKLTASRREGARLWAELEQLKEETSQQRAQRVASLRWRLVDRGARLREQIAPRGTRRRKICDSLIRQISSLST